MTETTTVPEPVEDDFVWMDPDELDAWILANSPALSSFSLNTHDGRRGFLHELFMRGYPALFEGVSHMWKLMEPPKQERCFGLGLAAGTGGTGKTALLNFLTRLIDEGLASSTPLPECDDFSSMSDWNDAVTESWRDDERRLSLVIERYAQLMVADPCKPVPPSKLGKVIKGPWSPAGQAD